MSEISDMRALLPHWTSHKEVQADRIVEVLDGAGLALMRWRLACGAVVDVDELLASRVPLNTPSVGGYFVLYADGYRSWSPAAAFDAGYTRLEETT
jgi:hypothetical protein